MDQHQDSAEPPDAMGLMRAGEARFRAVVDGFGDPILILDGYGIIRYVNPEFLRAFGYVAADVIGKPFEGFLPLAERAEIVAALRRQEAETGGMPRLEHHFIQRDGSLEIAETSANILNDPANLHATLLHMRVVTARKRAEETLRASEERYRQLVEHSHDLIQSIAPDGRILFANHTWLETLGYAEADLADLNLWDIIHPASRAECEQSFAALWQNQDVGVLHPTFLTRHGAAVEVEGVAVVQMEHGRPIATNTFFRNVTEERRNARVQAVRFAVARILAESPRLNVALGQVMEAIAANLGWQIAELWLPDATGQVLHRRDGWHIAGHPGLDRFARASRDLHFAHGEGLPGQTWASGEVIWEKDLDQSRIFRRAALSKAAGIRCAVAIPIKQGQDVIGVMLFGHRYPQPIDEPLAAVLSDLGAQLGQFAARKQAEDALQAERVLLARRVEERTADLSRLNEDLARAVRAKDEFLANMSHELRTPLNTILALSEVLLEQVRGPLNERQQGSVRNIAASGQHLLMLINDILDLSKVEAGRLDLFLEPVIVADVCQASLMFVRELAHKKQLQLSFQLNDQWAVMAADQKRLKQMLVNLLSNAVKFTPAGGKVSLHVEVLADRGSIRFAVHDTGIGISAENQARLFEPFSQLESSLRRQHEGTGLGLALVRRLAELHGGMVTVESAEGQGSCFTITLPYRQSAEVGAPPSGSARTIAAGAENAAAPALIIDDSESAADQLARYLESMNFQVVIHPHSEGALEQVLERRPRVIFLDLLMPGPSGWEILLQLKADPRTRPIPVVIVSVVDERVKGMAAGAAAYLVKPLARDALRDALRAAAVAEGVAQESIEAPQPAARPLRELVLLADDNESNIEVIGDYLSDQGYRLAVARNGREALEQAVETRPDIILLDIQMPEIDGLEVARRLRADPRHAATPILALTALAMPGDRERCLAAGASEYMTKPVSLKGLARIIRRLLEQR